MHLTSSELQALDRARYDLAALQVEVQLLRLQLIYKANFNPNQPRVPRGHRDGGRWTRLGGGAGESGTARRVGAGEDTRPAEPMDRGGTETTTLPGNRELVRDRSGTEPWEVYVDTLRPNGSVAERVVINRDGSAIRSEFSTTPELTGWDESHTVVGAGGNIATFLSLGKTQTILDGRGQVMQVAMWTEQGPRLDPRGPNVDRLFGSDDPGFDGAILGLALPLYAWFASTATPDEAPILAFRAREFRKPQSKVGIEPVYVGRLKYEDVKTACPGIADVQGWTNDAATEAGPAASYASPSAYGTAVHTRLKGIVRAQGDDDLKAENSYLKSKEEGYGILGTIRIDVLDRRRDKALPGTVCVYDIKTGASSLGKARSAEIVRNVLRTFPGTSRFIVIEVRPGQ